MSKIEKALNKARTSGALRVISNPASPRPEPSAGTALDVTTQMTLLEQRSTSSAAIARMQEKKLLSKQALSHNRVIYPELGENGTVRAFREIRTRIIQKCQGRNCVLMVTSVTGKGGSSFVSLNLGAAFSFDAGKTALLVDCNLKAPSLDKLFADGMNKGLTDFMENPSIDVGDIIHPVGIERLRIIPAGGKREIPAEYFTSLKMRRLLDGIKHRYPERYVIIDSPPMTESADTQILAELCDYVILVVPYGRVTDTQVDSCIKAIGEKKLLGIVFNNEPAQPDFNWMRVLLNPLIAIKNLFVR